MDALRNFLPWNNTLYTLQNLLYLVLFVLLVAAIIPFFLLTFYAHPSADDFSYAASYRSGDFWNHVVGEYLTWKGRYFAIFVTVFFHQSGDMIANYKYPLLINLTLIFFALYYLVRSVFEEKASFQQTLFCTLALGVFYIITLPKVSAALYWADGAFQYQVGSIVYILALGSLLRLYREVDAPFLSTLTSVLFIFAAIGSTEIFMISLSTLVGLIFLYKFFIEKQNRLPWSVVLAVTATSSALLLFAPGNALRMQFQPENNQQFWFSIGRSLFHGGEALVNWAGNPTLWFLSILFIPVALYLIYIKGVKKDASWARFFLVLALLLGQIWVCFFATWWAGATPAPWRTLNVIYLIFLVGWFFLLFELIAVLSMDRKLVYIDRIFSIPSRLLMMVSIITLSVLLVGKSHMRDAYSALLGSAAAYDHFMKDRYAYIQQQKKEAGPGRHPSITTGVITGMQNTLAWALS
jgi:hypothetical protein